ncbi:MAG: aminotransferase class V-fold PLP-dependent enzyme [Thalassobaculaceae bacterium]
MKEIDVEKVRAETRGCSNLIHFNNAGASLMPAPVADYLCDFLREEEIKGGYETRSLRNAEIENFYTSVSRLLNANPKEIAFVENATRAWDMVFYALPLGPGDKILTTVSEYGSNLIAYLHRAKQTGAEVVIVPNDNTGQIDVNALEQSIDKKTKLISISHIPTGGGLVNPAHDVGRIAKKHGIPFLLDACQSVGQMHLDVQKIGCDFLSATGRKYLRGPRGTGFLYVQEDWIERLEPPLLDQYAADLIDANAYEIRTDARRFENWERYFAGQAALGQAVDYAMELGLEAIERRVVDLAASLREGLQETGVLELTDQGVKKSGLVTFQHQRLDAEQVKALVSKQNINVSTSSGSGMKLSYLERGLDGLVRASVHYYNTAEEIKKFITAVRSL